MARVLITGASGFIGSHLARACLARGDAVSVLLRPASRLDRLQGIAPQLQLLRAPPQDPAALAAALAAARPQILFHAAAATRFRAEPGLEDLGRSIGDNLLPLTALLGAAAAAAEPPQVLVRLGTIAEYGAGPERFSETAREAPLNAYGASMLAATRYLEMAQPRLPFAAATARLALTYGPGQSQDFLIPQLARNLTAGRVTELRSPHSRRELIHVEDAVAGLLAIAARPAAAGPVVNLGSGLAPDMAELAALMARLAQAPQALIRLPAEAAAGRGTGSLLHTDTSRIRSRLGWAPQFTLAEGLERILQWEQQMLQTPAGAQKQDRKQA
ncbi:MAG: NAD(P)-dependent oxidoreductase [Rhodobacteraceae bacterium]|nr:NAD(P)-dependent oxidoreductase [Paracoccaceae bacterium]